MLPYLKWYRCNDPAGPALGLCLVLLLSLAAGSLAEAVQVTEFAFLKEVRYWTDSGYTRVVLDLDKKVDYKTHRLDADQQANRTSRIFLDLPLTKCGENLPPLFILDEGPVQAIRTARHDTNTSRLVLDLRQVERYKVFPLEKPHRIVIDLWKTKSAVSSAPSGLEAEKSTVPQQVSKTYLPFVVLDPGHGGKDPGAISKGGLMEKDVVYKIAKYTKEILLEEMVAQVALTRQKDVFIPLEKRTRFANSRQADLFVSIHANAYPTPDIRGAETFYLDNTTDRAAMRLAALENATANIKRGDLQGILLTLRQNANALESHSLAQTVQTSLIRGLGKKGYRDVPSLGVKGNLFYVLVGAKMPSILVEVSFITNAKDEKRLRTQKYQRAIAQGIAEGIKNYFEQGGLKTILAQQ